MPTIWNACSGKWKLELPRTYQTLNGRPGGHGGRPVPYSQRHFATAELYDLDADIGEKHDVAPQHPAVMKRLLAYVEQARQDLGDDLTQRKGSGRRPAGRVSSQSVYPSDLAFPRAAGTK